MMKTRFQISKEKEQRVEIDEWLFFSKHNVSWYNLSINKVVI